MLIIIARHGPREPLSILPKLPEWNKLGRLTIKGKECCKKFGSRIRRLYFPCEFNIMDFYMEGNEISRVNESAQYFKEGFFNLDTFENNFIDFNNSLLAGDYKYNQEEKDIIDKISDNVQDVLMQTMAADIYKLNCYINKIFNYTITHVRQYVELRTTIECYKYEDLQLPHKWTKDLDDKLHDLTKKYYFEFYSRLNNMNLNKINELYEYVLNLKNKNYKIMYLSTHDSVLYPLLLKIQKELGSDRIPHFPDFCSNIRIYKKENSNEMEFLYDGIRI